MGRKADVGLPKEISKIEFITRDVYSPKMLLK